MGFAVFCVLAVVCGSVTVVTSIPAQCTAELQAPAPACAFDVLDSRLAIVEILQRSTASTLDNVTNIGEGIDYLSVRIDGSSGYKGIAEVYRHGHWGTICGDSWTDVEANTFCRMIGYGCGKKQMPAVSTMPYLLSNVVCTNADSSIFDCGYKSLGVSDTPSCREDQAATVKCNLGVRLTGHADPYRGLVEINHMGQWGTICDNGWTDNGSGNANVICRMMGYPRGGHAYTRSAFGAGTSGLIMLDNVRCLGVEDSLFECPRSDFRPFAVCSSHNLAAVVCDPYKEPVPSASTCAL